MRQLLFGQAGIMSSELTPYAASSVVLGPDARWEGLVGQGWVVRTDARWEGLMGQGWVVRITEETSFHRMRPDLWFGRPFSSHGEQV